MYYDLALKRVFGTIESNINDQLLYYSDSYLSTFSDYIKLITRNGATKIEYKIKENQLKEELEDILKVFILNGNVYFCSKEFQDFKFTVSLKKIEFAKKNHFNFNSDHDIHFSFQ